MSGKREKRRDLLDLPMAKRKRLCFDIRAALHMRVAVGKIPVSDDAIIADNSMWNSLPAKPFDDGERDNLKRSTVEFAHALEKP
jgi:hypothetical protein